MVAQSLPISYHTGVFVKIEVGCSVSTFFFLTISNFPNRAKILARKSPPISFCLDINWLGTYWNCFEGKGRVYHHTGPVNLLYGLREGLAILAEEGLEACWERHRMCAEKLHQGTEFL